MVQRRIVLGAIGGDGQKSCALAFGAAAARAGCIVLTGGGDDTDDEVKNAVIEGARAVSTPNTTARFVGILPCSESRQGSHVEWNRPTPNGLLLQTGLAHYVRNLINGVTPDVLVVFGGSRGTLAEAAFAAAAGKMLFFYGFGEKGPAVERLRCTFEVCFTKDIEGNVDKFLARPLKVWPEIAGRRITPDQLLALLKDRLDRAVDWHSSADELVQRCCNEVMAHGQLPETGFPGLPGDLSSKRRFESEIEIISR